jgi:hypothetical protein
VFFISLLKISSRVSYVFFVTSPTFQLIYSASFVYVILSFLAQVVLYGVGRSICYFHVCVFEEPSYCILVIELCARDKEDFLLESEF